MPGRAGHDGACCAPRAFVIPAKRHNRQGLRFLGPAFAGATNVGIGRPTLPCRPGEGRDPVITDASSSSANVRDDAHSNTAEGYFSVRKRGVNGTFHHISEAHLHRYLAEFDFRYNNGSSLGVTDAERTNRIAEGIEGKRLTYRRTGEAAN